MAIINYSHLIYTVKPGDTLNSIAELTGSNVATIEQVNFLYPPITDRGLIYPGQILLIPSSGMKPVVQITSAGDTIYQYSKRYSTSVDVLLGLNPQIPLPSSLNINQSLQVPAFIYEIEVGDTLNRIAKRFGTSLSTILEANRERPGISPDLIYPGYRLIIPLPSSNNILTLKPFPGTSIRAGDTLQGLARAFEGVILYRIVDKAGQTVTNETPLQTSAGAPAFGTFSTRLRIDRRPPSSTGEIWVYTRSPRDGSIQDLVQVRILFSYLI